MEIFIENQLKNIGYSIILGLIFGAFYDIIRILHILVGIASYSGEKSFRRDKWSRAVFFVTDLCFMLSVTVMLSVFLYEFASGDLRMYLLISAAVGFALYHYTVGKLIMAVSEAIVRVIRLVFRVTVVKPVRFMLGILGKIGVWLYGRTVGALLEKLRFLRDTHRLECARKKLAREIRFE